MGFFCLTQRARRSQRELGHRGERTLARRTQRSRLAAEGGHREGAESSEGSEGSESRGIFRPHTEDTEAQRVLGHRGELTLAWRAQRSCARYLRFGIVGGHRGSPSGEWDKASHRGQGDTESIRSQRRADARGEDTEELCEVSEVRNRRRTQRVA